MTSANCFITQLYQLADSKGLDAPRLLQDAGIPGEVIGSASARVANEKLAVLLESIWDELQDEAMGLGESIIPRGAFFMMGKLAINEPNLHKALHVSARYYGMITTAYRVELEVTGPTALLKFTRPAPELDPCHLFGEITLLAWHRFFSWLITENIALKDVFFDYSTPAHVAEYAYLFPGRHRFNTGFHGFSFSSSYLDKDISKTQAALKAFIKNCPCILFDQPQTDFSVSYELKKELKKTMANGFPLIDDAAEHMHMTKRTLIRKLSEEGTSYQELKDMVRRDRAIYLLTEQNLALGDIANAVGFSDPAVFARAFKSWTGVPPSDYRSSARGD